MPRGPTRGPAAARIRDSYTVLIQVRARSPHRRDDAAAPIQFTAALAQAAAAAEPV